MIVLAAAFMLATGAPAQESCLTPRTVDRCSMDFMPKAPIAPSKTERARLTALIDAARVLDGAAEKARITFEKANAEVQRLRATRSVRWVPVDGEEDAAADLQRAARALKNAREARYAAYNSAIKEVVAGYGLTPPVTDFSHDAGLSEFQRATRKWSPRFSELEEKDEHDHWRARTADELDKQAADASKIAGTATTAASAQTWATGDISIFAVAFSPTQGVYTSDKLAALIYHETSHWLDAVVRGQRAVSPFDRYSGEVRAYLREVKIAQTLGLPTDGLLKVASVYASQANQVRGRDWNWVEAYHKQDWLDSSEGPSREFGSYGVDPGDPESLKTDAERRFEMEAAKAAVPDAVQASAAPTVAISANQMPTRAMQADYTSAVLREFEVMRAIAGEVCGNPGALTERRLRDLGEAWRSWQDDIRGSERLQALNVYEGLGGCPLTVLTAILTRSPSGTPGTASDRDWVVQLAYAQTVPQVQPMPRSRAVDGSKGSDITDIEKRKSYQDAKGWKKP